MPAPVCDCTSTEQRKSFLETTTPTVKALWQRCDVSGQGVGSGGARRSYTVPNGGGDKCLACLSGFELHSALGESIEGERRLRKESKSIGNRECELRLPDLHLKEQGSELSARSELFERSNKSGGITRD